MAWIQIYNTNWEYDDDAYDKIPEVRKNFWARNPNVSISSGIISRNNNRLYLRVRKVGTTEPIYTESELNKIYFDSKFGTNELWDYNDKYLIDYNDWRLEDYI
jgi:hypothetical protein